MISVVFSLNNNIWSTNEKQKENKKHLSSNMCCWNIDTNTRNILYTSPAVTSGGCLESNGLDPQLQFTAVTSTDLPHRAPAEGLRPHTCHQFGYRLFWNNRNEDIKWTETYRRELRLHLGSWPHLLYQGYPYQANPSNAVQDTLGHSG